MALLHGHIVVTKRIGDFASGGGSNAVKLMESMQGDHPAMPAPIVTNQPNAGLFNRPNDLVLRAK